MSNVHRVDALIPTIAVTNEQDAIILYDALKAHSVKGVDYTERVRSAQLAVLVAEELVNLRRSEREPSVATLVNERDRSQGLCHEYGCTEHGSYPHNSGNWYCKRHAANIT